MTGTPDLAREASRNQKTSELSRVVEEVRSRSLEPSAEEGREATDLEAETTGREAAKTIQPPPKQEPEQNTIASLGRVARSGDRKSAQATRQKAPEAVRTQDPPAPPPSTPVTARAEPERSSPTKARPQLVRDSVFSPQEEPDSAASPHSEAEEAAFASLLANSPVAKSLVGGEIDTLNFAEWSVVQKTPSAVWIDLVAHWATGGQEVHLIWAIDISTGRVRPLSQAARTLESDAGR